MLNLSELATDLKTTPRLTGTGKLVSSKGSVLVAKIPNIAIGDSCQVSRRDGSILLCCVVGFEGDLCYLAPFDDISGISSNAQVSSSFKPFSINISNSIIGKIIDPTGNTYPPTEISSCLRSIPIQNKAPSALERRPVNQQFFTGISAIDLFTPIAYGQKIGIFAGPGAGKSTLLSMLCKSADYDLVVVGLIGERGRELSEFIEKNLTPEDFKKCILVVSTSDESSYRRFVAAQTATSIAEHFRDQGKKVLLLIDSLTRAARALRDLSLAAGEMPIRQGYTPSVYAELPKLLERTGNTDKGSITAIYVLLTQNDQANDPLGEEVKSILDGHIILSEEIANHGIRPAIDITRSVSRVALNLWDKEHRELITRARYIINRLGRDKDILLMGGEADLELKAALEVEADLHRLLNQAPEEKKDFTNCLKQLQEIVNKVETTNITLS